MSAVTPDVTASLESLEDVARRELGETPAVKQTALNDLRKLISGEPSLYCPTDEAFLVKFLRARKYDAQSAFYTIKKYFEVRRDHPEVFKDLTPSCIPFDVVCRKHRLLTVSRSTDSLGRMVVLNKMGAWNTQICSLNDYFRVGLAVCEYFLLREHFQVRGIVCIIDLKGLNIYHLAHYTPSAIRMLISLTQIRLFGYNLKELHQLVPDDVISEEHEGTNEKYDYDRLERELKSAEGFFQALNSYGYRETLSTKETNGVLTDEELPSEDYVHL
ncbi:alpha-tocopherol transfer protein-like isoform X2 [Dermacentor silvarum]|uniref:alpha-tocopherol transfer protein-like isoform X2 n=1 Tax=Dermacentor silvarum TaxID=543639 RepID=UPI002100CDE6|nr:alpha-tocopherol transfer protein-like isoform X2 [Dermacentor silvarum]